MKGSPDTTDTPHAPIAVRRGRTTRAAPRSGARITAPSEIDLTTIPETIRKEMSMNAETVLKSLEAITPAVEKVTADALAQGKANLETVVEKGQEMMGTAVKSVSEMSEFAKGNVDAMMVSAKAATTGFETISNLVVEHSKKSFEETTAAMKSMAAAKSPAELFQLQNDFAKARFDHAVAMWSALSETMLKVAGDIAQPMSSRIAIAGEKVKTLVAVK